jgi:nucleoside-diphosphate-sugar epimerase
VFHEQGSILDSEILSRILAKHQITHVIHAAGARTHDCAHHPLLGFEANVFGTDHVFRAARTCSTVTRVIHFSTAAVYGGNRSLIDETAPLAPVTPYAITKAASEMAALGHGGEASFQTVILRPGFVLGPQSKGTLTTSVRQAMRDSEVTFTFPEQFHIHWTPDLVHAVERLLEVDLPNQIEVLHLPGQTVQLSDFTDSIAKACRARGRSPTLQATPQPDAPLPRLLDFKKILQLAGHLPSTSLDKMIQTMLS